MTPGSVCFRTSQQNDEINTMASSHLITFACFMPWVWWVRCSESPFTEQLLSSSHSLGCQAKQSSCSVRKELSGWPPREATGYSSFWREGKVLNSWPRTDWTFLGTSPEGLQLWGLVEVLEDLPWILCFFHFTECVIKATVIYGHCLEITVILLSLFDL